MDAHLSAQCRPAAIRGQTLTGPWLPSHIPAWKKLHGLQLSNVKQLTTYIYHHSRSSQPAGEAATSVHHRPAAPLSNSTVVEYNVAQLQASGQAHCHHQSCPHWTQCSQGPAPADDAGGLEAVICLATSARKLWVDVGLGNGAMGTIRAIVLEDHLIYLLLSWFTLTATPALLFMTAPSPSLLFAAAGPPWEASAHVYSCPSS